jgi:hypothetical protein
MRHFLLLLCSLLLFTNAVSADEFSEYLTNEWGVELSINIEEVTSSHITQNDIQTTEGSACPESLCVCMDVRDEEKSSFNSFRKRALIKPQTWRIPNIRNAIPEADNSRFSGIAYASYTAVDALKMDLLSDMASCTLYAASQGGQERFTNGTIYMYANLRQGGAEEAIFILSDEADIREALSEESNNPAGSSAADVCDAAGAERMQNLTLDVEHVSSLMTDAKQTLSSMIDLKRTQSSMIGLKRMPSLMIGIRQTKGSMTDKHWCRLRTERSNSPEVAIQS